MQQFVTELRTCRLGRIEARRQPLALSGFRFTIAILESGLFGCMRRSSRVSKGFDARMNAHK